MIQVAGTLHVSCDTCGTITDVRASTLTPRIQQPVSADMKGVEIALFTHTNVCTVCDHWLYYVLIVHASGGVERTRKHNGDGCSVVEGPDFTVTITEEVLK